MSDASRLPSDDTTFDKYTDDDWKHMLDYMWGRTIDELTIGRRVPEQLVVFVTRHGRPVTDTAEIGFMRAGSQSARLHAMSAVIKRTKAHAYAYIMESWYKVTTNEEYAKYKRGDLSRDPSRKEALIVVLVTKNGLKLSRMGEIIRLGGERDMGQASEVRVIDVPGMQASGAMFELMD